METMKWIGIWILILTGTTCATSSNGESQAETMHDVAFRYQNDRAQSVDLVGSFNQWKLGALPMSKTETGVWVVKVSLSKGSYQYMFVVNGLTWVPDPKAPTSVPDGFGQANSLLVIE
jgi:1,4-alpha-glucan branching enzyme